MEQQVSSARLLRYLRRLIAGASRTAIPACLLLTAGAVPGWPADQPLEYQVKAAFLLNFTKFIDWPAAASGGAEAPFTICVLGENPFGTALDQIVAGEAVNGRKITVGYLNRTPAQPSCQILFRAGAGKKSGHSRTWEREYLLSGKDPSSSMTEGMIAFVIENHRVRFEINRTAAEKAGLKLSSKLLSVAKSVEK